MLHQRTERWSSALLLTAALAALWTSGLAHTALLQMRSNYSLTAERPLDNSPPLMAFTTVVLGGFRGILADALWLRATSLLERGNYAEIVQLADWITKLEPRCPEVWIFHARNMSYNASALMPTHADRWRWVRHGISLLRDEALTYNPSSAAIHAEMSWLFLNKIGGTADASHSYYERAWSEEMMMILPDSNPGPDSLTQEDARRYKLDPALLRELDREYGPFDWRHHYSHAAYWAYKGIALSRNRTESVMTHRLLCHSLASIFRQGHGAFSHGASPAPFDPQVLPRVLKAYDQAMDAHPDAGFGAARDHFIRAAVSGLRSAGHEQLARDTFSLLSTHDSNADTVFDDFILHHAGHHDSHAH